MKNKADIFLDKSTLEVVVVDECGVEVFRRAKTEQTVSIANAIYMSHKYGDRA
jgi:hypothetical protein